MADCEAEERLPAIAASDNHLLVIVTSTYTEGSPPESAKWFFNWVQEAAQDFR
jgi:sulfite reductase alpha subunit-like flavoprotein